MVESFSGPIWRLVEDCAHDLTTGGLTPFTRGDLITCVQRKNPRYGPDSINPIIQGLTDNLRGGAQGTVGKNVLHSVGRGLFQLRDQRHACQPGPTVFSAHRTRKHDEAKRNVRRRQSADEQSSRPRSSIRLDRFSFAHVVDISPERRSDGQICEYLPQRRYRNEDGIPLNRYGQGPFCKFRIPSDMYMSGVYAITVDGDTRYIGECQSLTDRFNMGYGNISPRNCFVGGQETNCRINKLVLDAASEAKEISLWFHRTSDYKRVEAQLRDIVRPIWNRV